MHIKHFYLFRPIKVPNSPGFWIFFTQKVDIFVVKVTYLVFFLIDFSLNTNSRWIFSLLLCFGILTASVLSCQKYGGITNQRINNNCSEYTYLLFIYCMCLCDIAIFCDLPLKIYARTYLCKNMCNIIITLQFQNFAIFFSQCEECKTSSFINMNKLLHYHNLYQMNIL